MNPSMKSVSVVVPCFNRADTVEAAVRSVLEQDWPDLEVIAVDDGSEDSTWDTLLLINDARLRCFRNPGKGAPSARNFGAYHASGTWIAYQDSDDIWLPGKLNKQMDRLLEGDYVAAYCGMLVKKDISSETKAHHRHPSPSISPLEGRILPSLVRNSFISTQTLVVRKDVLQAVGGFDESFRALQDWDLMIRIAQVGAVAFVDEDLVLQRMSPNSITKSEHWRLVALEKLLEKHFCIIAQYPGALEHHYRRLFGAYRKIGAYKEAARQAYLAYRVAPLKLHYLFAFVLVRFLACFGSVAFISKNRGAP